MRHGSDVVPTLPEGDILYEPENLADGGRRIRNLCHPERHSKVLAELLRNEDLKALIGRLVHGNPVAIGVELFAKPAFAGSAVPYIRDQTSDETNWALRRKHNSAETDARVAKNPGHRRRWRPPDIARRIVDSELEGSVATFQSR